MRVLLLLPAAAEALAAALPYGQARTLEGQTHDIDPTVLGPVLAEFLRLDYAKGLEHD